MSLPECIVQLPPECCVYFWSLHLRKDLLELEEAYRMSARIMSYMGWLPCEERFCRLGLWSGTGMK